MTTKKNPRTEQEELRDLRADVRKDISMTERTLEFIRTADPMALDINDMVRLLGLLTTLNYRFIDFCNSMTTEQGRANDPEGEIPDEYEVVRENGTSVRINALTADVILGMAQYQRYCETATPALGAWLQADPKNLHALAEIMNSGDSADGFRVFKLGEGGEREEITHPKPKEPQEDHFPEHTYHDGPKRPF